MTNKRKNKRKNTSAQNIEVYNHVDNEFIKSNELTIPEHIFAWTVASLILIILVYAVL